LALATSTTVVAVPTGGVGWLARAGAEVTVDLEPPLICRRRGGAASMTATRVFAGWPQRAAHSTP